VLVTDAEGRATLAACRALHRAGYRVSAVATERPALSHWSRCNDGRLHAPNPRETVSGFARRLAEIVAARRYDAVLAGSDASLVAVSEHRAALEPYTRLGLPPPEVVDRALDKLALLEAADAAELAAPTSVVCTSEADAAEHAPAVGYPVILKPARSFLRRGDALTQRTPEIARTAEELPPLARVVGSPFVLQRYEQGTTILSCAGVMAAGALLAFVVARYARTWPVEAGPSSSSQTIEPPEDLAGRVEALVRSLGWEGIFQLQLLELDGRLATLDFNARLFGSLELAVAAEIGRAHV
jgi:D-aspartate ligase